MSIFETCLEQNICSIYVTYEYYVVVFSFFLSETTETKLGIVVTFAENIPLTDYANVVQNMETSVK